MKSVRYGIPHQFQFSQEFDLRGGSIDFLIVPFKEPAQLDDEERYFRYHFLTSPALDPDPDPKGPSPSCSFRSSCPPPSPSTSAGGDGVNPDGGSHRPCEHAARTRRGGDQGTKPLKKRQYEKTAGHVAPLEKKSTTNRAHCEKYNAHFLSSPSLHVGQHICSRRLRNLLATT